MRRFEFNEDDPERDEIENFLESGDAQHYMITPEEYKSLIEEELVLYETKFKHAEQKNNFKLLLISINMLKKSFWWKFKRLNTKLNDIEKTYNSLSKLMQPEEK